MGGGAYSILTWEMADHWGRKPVPPSSGTESRQDRFRKKRELERNADLDYIAHLRDVIDKRDAEIHRLKADLEMRDSALDIFEERVTYFLFVFAV